MREEKKGSVVGWSENNFLVRTLGNKFHVQIESILDSQAEFVTGPRIDSIERQCRISEKSHLSHRDFGFLAEFRAQR